MPGRIRIGSALDLYRIPYRPHGSNPIQGVGDLYGIPYRPCGICIGSHAGRIGFVSDPIPAAWDL
eukprot:3508415-Pyramimonas_sp.AAC.1